MQKPLSDGFSREIIAVYLEERGERREQDFDSLPETEKKRLRIQTNGRALQAAGYAPVEEKPAAKETASKKKMNEKKQKR